MARRTPRQQFAKAANEILRAWWEFRPTFAVNAGLHRYDGRLPDYSAAAFRRRIAQIRRHLGTLDKIEKRGLPSGRARLELGVLRGMLLSERFHTVDARDPQAFPPLYLFSLNIVNYLLRNYASLDRRLRAVARMQSQIPPFLDQWRAVADRRLADTYYGMADMAARGIADAYERELPEALAKASPGVRRLVEKTNAVAVREVRALVEELRSKYKPRVTSSFAIGPRKYARMIRAEHQTRIAPDRLLEVGMADLRANKAQFLETAKKLGPHKMPRYVMDSIERDHPSADSLLADTRAMLEDLRQFVVDREIVTVPSEDRAQVMETPRFYRFATAAMNSPGAFEKVGKEAFYYVTPVEDSWPPRKQEEWLRHLNYTTLRNISVHECYPGHYVHFLHRRRVKSRVLRSYFSYAFTEGWAHYCEEMMVDQGLGGGDPRLRLAMLQDALLRNCRYVCSIRMHTDGWTWERAARFFMENAFLDRLPAEREAKRGTWDPGYLNYTLGKLMVKKLRSDYLARHPGTSLREFHDDLLALGAPPLGLARTHLLGPDAGPAL